VKRTKRSMPRVANFCEFVWKITNKRKFLAGKSQVKKSPENEHSHYWAGPD